MERSNPDALTAGNTVKVRGTATTTDTTVTAPQRDDYTVLDYDRFFLQFGLVAEGLNTFGNPFVHVYSGRPKDDA